jgi:hypothetical protein
MHIALQSFLLDVPRAAAVWLVLLAVAVVAVTAFSDPPTLRAPRVTPSQNDAWSDVPLEDARRYADEVAVAAGRAAATARRRYAEWEKTHDALAPAWAAFDAADRAARRVAAAAAFPIPITERTPAQYAERERYLHRAARAACRRGELSSAHLADVLAHHNGWDPRHHPIVQDGVLRRFVREHLLTEYLSATAAERSAWRAAELADAAMRSLRDEARAAAARATVAERDTGTAWLEEQLRRGASPPVRVPARRLVLR